MRIVGSDWLSDVVGGVLGSGLMRSALFGLCRWIFTVTVVVKFGVQGWVVNFEEFTFTQVVGSVVVILEFVAKAIDTTDRQFFVCIARAITWLMNGDALDTAIVEGAGTG